MSTSAKDVHFDDSTPCWSNWPTGRTLSVPLAWFPRLLHATPEQRAACRPWRRDLPNIWPLSFWASSGACGSRGHIETNCASCATASRAHAGRRPAKQT
ncbi:DUF2442 domain-containing protein [Paraburkholderia phenazinium]|uniref:DUF2442 domain-containing protein n=1 Tax=Paraburkholderia phenazinium TaxID=60549 RepID=UPI0015897C27